MSILPSLATGDLEVLQVALRSLPTGDLEVLQIALRNVLQTRAGVWQDGIPLPVDAFLASDFSRDLKKSVLGSERAGNLGSPDANAGDVASTFMKGPVSLNTELLAHAVETFGSAAAARVWLSSECGALSNRTPIEAIQSDGDEVEVERVLDCIDYGMLA